MRPLKVRQAATAGVIMSFVLAAALSGRSTEPLQTFVYILALGLAITLLVTVGARAINRRRRPPTTP